MTDWAAFPARILRGGVQLHRIHRRGHVPAHFSDSGLHRFDSPLRAGSEYGVCYLGLDPLTAYVEVFGRYRAVQQVEILRRCLSTAHVTSDLRLADLTNRAVLGRYGVTAAHSTGSDYELSQDLGTRLHAAGFEGLCYRVRHDPAMTLEAVALFGPTGTARYDRPAISWSDPIEIPGHLIELGGEFGIRVLPPLRLP